MLTTTSYTFYEGKQIFDINVGNYPDKTWMEILWKADGIFTYKFFKLIFSVPIHSIVDFINLHSYTHICRSTKISEAKWSVQDHLCGTQRTTDTRYWFYHHIRWGSFWVVMMNCLQNTSVILLKSQQLLWNAFCFRILLLRSP